MFYRRLRVAYLRMPLPHCQVPKLHWRPSDLPMLVKSKRFKHGVVIWIFLPCWRPRRYLRILSRKNVQYHLAEKLSITDSMIRGYIDVLYEKNQPSEDFRVRTDY